LKIDFFVSFISAMFMPNVSIKIDPNVKKKNLF